MKFFIKKKQRFILYKILYFMVGCIAWFMVKINPARNLNTSLFCAPRWYLYVTEGNIGELVNVYDSYVTAKTKLKSWQNPEAYVYWDRYSQTLEYYNRLVARDLHERLHNELMRKIQFGYVYFVWSWEKKIKV